MLLKSINYVQFEGLDQEWHLHDFSVGSINLLVGKNASGKSRTLNIIKGLANLICGRLKPVNLKSGAWKIEFQHGADIPVYEVVVKDGHVEKEEFVVQGKTVLNRSIGGKGKIFLNGLDEDLEFQTPTNELAVVARRDSIQHPFFESLYQWGNCLRHFPFGTPLGKDTLVIVQSGGIEDDFDLQKPENVVAVFHKAITAHGSAFREAVQADLDTIGYPNADIGLARPQSIIFKGTPPGDPLGLYVKEKGLKAITDQNEMSQGMFRALSIVVQLNYFAFERRPSCLLIDDIGEGLDFDRSSALITLLIDKAESNDVQLIMATNDRFVMNRVPLNMWSILERNENGCRAYNYTNSKEKFDEFKFTGMNNFDFLATDFINAGRD